MTEGVVKQEQSALGNIVITQEQVELVKNVVFSDATDDELKLFFFECKRRGVHPLDRLIHPVKRQGKVTFQTSIDLFRSQAEETGEYRGQLDTEYGEMIVGPGRKVPEWAKATVKRYDSNTGETINISATAYWDEYYPGEKMGFQWIKMPRLMLAKCAEALAIRKAFPKKLAGLYTFEEMVLTDLVNQGTKPPPSQPKSKSSQGKDTDIASLRTEIWRMLMETEGNEFDAGLKLQELSRFQAKGKDWKEGDELQWVEGKTDLKDLKDTRIPATYGRTKQFYEEWKGGQENANV